MSTRGSSRGRPRPAGPTGPRTKPVSVPSRRGSNPDGTGWRRAEANGAGTCRSPQPLIPGVGGLGGGGFLGFGVALRTGDRDDAAAGYLVTGVGGHLIEEIRRNRRD